MGSPFFYENEKGRGQNSPSPLLNQDDGLDSSIIVLDSDSEENKENVRARTVPRVYRHSQSANYTDKDIRDLEGSI